MQKGQTRTLRQVVGLDNQLTSANEWSKLRRTTPASGTLPWNGFNDVRTPVSDPLERARVHAYAKRHWRDRRTGTSRPLGPPDGDGAHSSIC